MRTAAAIATAFVAVLHLVFFVLESFFWTKPLGRRVFGLPADVAAASASLAVNQGLYNAFLAAGLIWGLLPGGCAFSVKVFFLSCVIVAGIVGGLTAKRSILLVQALPGAIALVLVWLARS
jgi:putative membrane protein